MQIDLGSYSVKLIVRHLFFIFKKRERISIIGEVTGERREPGGRGRRYRTAQKGRA